MIQVIRAQERHFSDFEWLKTYWLFSFSDYYDPQNIQFGALRVLNDDIVEPGTGYCDYCLGRRNYPPGQYGE
jgi:redox-sensitive bicupin YhaK (pirin superfamily)